MGINKKGGQPPPLTALTKTLCVVLLLSTNVQVESAFRDSANSTFNKYNDSRDTSERDTWNQFQRDVRETILPLATSPPILLLSFNHCCFSLLSLPLTSPPPLSFHPPPPSPLLLLPSPSSHYSSSVVVWRATKTIIVFSPITRSQSPAVTPMPVLLKKTKSTVPWRSRM